MWTTLLMQGHSRRLCCRLCSKAEPPFISFSNAGNGDTLGFAARFFDRNCAGLLEGDDIEEIAFMTAPPISRASFFASNFKPWCPQSRRRRDCGNSLAAAVFGGVFTIAAVLSCAVMGCTAHASVWFAAPGDGSLEMEATREQDQLAEPAPCVSAAGRRVQTLTDAITKRGRLRCFACATPHLPACCNPTCTAGWYIKGEGKRPSAGAVNEGGRSQSLAWQPQHCLMTPWN